MASAICALSALEAYNKTAAEPLKNPRNAAAGALRNLDPKVTASRKLSGRVLVRRGLYRGARVCGSPRKCWTFLRENRFPVSDCELWADDIEGVIAAIRQIEETRGDLDYMIDGAVVDICDYADAARAGLYRQVPALGGGLQVRGGGGYDLSARRDVGDRPHGQAHAAGASWIPSSWPARPCAARRSTTGAT